MATCLVQFIQNAVTGTAGRATQGTVALGVVRVQNGGSNTGATHWKIELLSVPEGSALSTGVKVDSDSVNFYDWTPDTDGMYLWRITVTAPGGPYIDSRAFGIPHLATGRMTPCFTPAGISGVDAFNFGGQTKGYSPYVDASLKAMNDVGIGGTKTSNSADAFTQPFNDIKTTATTDATADVVLYNDYTLPVKTCARVDVIITCKGVGIAAMWHIKMLVDRDSSGASVAGTVPSAAPPDEPTVGGATALSANVTLVGNVPTVVGTGIAATVLHWGVTIQVIPTRGQ